MKYLPKSVTRFAGRTLLKLNSNSPTILVVGGVVGLGATAVMAARASRGLDKIVDTHNKQRAEIGYISKHENKAIRKEQQQAVLSMYVDTTIALTRLYGPTLVVGTISAASVLSGHKILKGRHIASMAAYSGLAEQMAAYRNRVAQTLGETAERDIFNGAHGEYVEDPDHKGEYKLQPVYGDQDKVAYCRPMFEKSNPNCSNDPHRNYFFLKGVQSHMNTVLQTRGHVSLNDVYDALRIPRVPEGQVMGWLYEAGTGDDYIDFGFMTQETPDAIAFRAHEIPELRLNFNVDDTQIWQHI